MWCNELERRRRRGWASDESSLLVFWIETTYEGGLSKYTFPLCLWEDGRGKDQTSRRARPVILIGNPTWVIVVISAGGAGLNSDWVAGSVWYELLDGQERRLEAVGSPQKRPQRRAQRVPTHTAMRKHEEFMHHLSLALSYCSACPASWLLLRLGVGIGSAKPLTRAARDRAVTCQL